MKSLVTKPIIAMIAALALPMTLLAAGQNTPISQNQKSNNGQQVEVMNGQNHPHIRMAMRMLHIANTSLSKAPSDFGGHRVNAMKLIAQAEEELKQALEYAEQHPEEFKHPQNGASSQGGNSQGGAAQGGGSQGSDSQSGSSQSNNSHKAGSHHW